ncbi:FecR family protein [Fortiea contorta]|uniref:FecR family protein n=1 Tax=Fortiea contorta TaxID=1892405 RepID=UPI00036A72CD|nr:FecR domain-containing protein [Fortiea contorta]
MKNWCIYAALTLIGVIYTPPSIANEQIQVRIERWLEVRHLTGTVLYSRGGNFQPAVNGMRLQAVGDTISTKENSRTILALDSGMGFIQVSENTTLTVLELQAAKSGGKITQLAVKAGQVRLQVRPFTNPASRLEIHTPVGISGVRGTEFGVTVQPNGKTSVATLEGGVATAAQGQTVLVNAGFQNFTAQGEPPSIPVPIQENTHLNLSQIITHKHQVRVVGNIDPVNMLKIVQHTVNTDTKGKFDITVPLSANRRIKALVITPLGKKQLYELAVP